MVIAAGSRHNTGGPEPGRAVYLSAMDPEQGELTHAGQPVTKVVA
jgi:hypothetical protein